MSGAWKAPALAAALLAAGACRCASIDDLIELQPLTQHVDPLIGTKGEGNVIPGAQLPHGMVKLSPDTHVKAGSLDGYEYGDARIEGFSHTHLEGPGGSGYGYSELLVVPVRGELAAAPDEDSYSSRFSHESEVVRPGYYAVDLQDAAARAEVTATEHCGVHRYTFAAGTGASAANVLVDIGHSRGAALVGVVDVVGDRAFEGQGSYEMSPAIELVVGSVDPETSTGRRTLFFRAEFSRPFDRAGTWKDGALQAGVTHAEGERVGAFAGFDAPEAAPPPPVEVRLCISYVDLQHARDHLAAEAAGRAFEDLKSAADDAWNRKLNRVQVEGGTDDERRLFYTALYHAHIQPADVTEGDRFWVGAGAGAVLEAKGRRHFSDDWCLWDTFRTTHPLQLLLEPHLRADVVRSLVRTYEQGGWLEKCTWQATGYSRVMIGNHAVAVIADAYQKGFRDPDGDAAAALAYAAMRKAQTEENEEFLLNPFCGYFDLGTPPDYIANGWVPHECDRSQAASMTLELAYDDFELAQVARMLGKRDDANAFAARALNYRNVWNPAHGFMQARHRDGAFVEPFDPAELSLKNGFTEATAWIYTWFVPHDARGLIELAGGREAFVAKLDEYFAGGHNDLSNEPAFHAPYLYDYAGRPDRTQAAVRELMASHFTAAPDGLPGNDDAGAMSAWYVFAALGLYPMPGKEPVYAIGSPAFAKATIWLDPKHFAGTSFVIEARGTSAQNVYVQSAELDGAPLERPWISHARLAAGGHLVLTMGPATSAWGSAADAAPPSLSDP